MITSEAQLKQWLKWILDEEFGEVCRAMQAKIDGLDQAGPELVKAARNEYASDDVEIDGVAGKSETGGGAWVQAWVWVSKDEMV